MQKFLAAALATLFLTAYVCFVPAYALPSENGEPRKTEDSNERHKHGKGNHFRQRWVEFEKDPLKVLSEKKEKVQILLREGKITKEQAEEINRNIDEKIKAVNDFNKLSLKDKKELMLRQFNSSLDERVKAGKMTSDFAEELKKEYQGKIEQWDGVGYPGFLVRGVLFKDRHNHDDSSTKGTDKPDIKDKPDKPVNPDKLQKPDKLQNPDQKQDKLQKQDQRPGKPQRPDKLQKPDKKQDKQH